MSISISRSGWKLRGDGRAAGWLFMLWLALAGLERFLVEFLRAKDDRFFGVLTLAQLISLAIVATGIIGMTRMRREQVPAHAS